MDGEIRTQSARQLLVRQGVGHGTVEDEYVRAVACAVVAELGAIGRGCEVVREGRSRWARHDSVVDKQAASIE